MNPPPADFSFLQYTPVSNVILLYSLKSRLQHLPTMSPILVLWLFHAQDINVPVVSFNMAHTWILTS